MKIEKKIKNILTIVLLLAILIYHFLGITTPETILEIFKQFDTTIFSITRILVTVLLLIFTVSNKYIAMLFNWNNYIGGKYKGNIIDHNNLSIDYKIELTIKQSLLNTKITGVSFVLNNNKISTEYVVQGNIAKYDTNSYKFIVELEGINNLNYGLLTLRFEDNIANGFLYENNPAQTREVQIVKENTKIMERLKKWMCKN